MAFSWRGIWCLSKLMCAGEEPDTQGRKGGEEEGNGWPSKEALCLQSAFRQHCEGRPQEGTQLQQQVRRRGSAN
eukprot:2822308-Amphidinium_carterae.1